MRPAFLFAQRPCEVNHVRRIATLDSPEKLHAALREVLKDREPLRHCGKKCATQNRGKFFDEKNDRRIRRALPRNLRRLNRTAYFISAADERG